MPSSSHSAHFLVIWEFFVRPGSESPFEQAYGPAGAWVELFSSDPNYIRTDLQRDLRQPSRYLTLDYWTSEAAYENFSAAHQGEYESIDHQCEELTERELLIGRFGPVPGSCVERSR